MVAMSENSSNSDELPYICIVFPLGCASPCFFGCNRACLRDVSLFQPASPFAAAPFETRSGPPIHRWCSASAVRNRAKVSSRNGNSTCIRFGAPD